MSCISAARTMSSSWLSARPRRRPTPIACAATFGSAAAELPARRSERICSRTSRTWRSEDRRCQRERARTRSCAIASALDPVGRLLGDPCLAADGAGGETLGDAAECALGGGGRGQRRALDRAEEGVEVCVEPVGAGPLGLRGEPEGFAEAAWELGVRSGEDAPRRGRRPPAGRAARSAPGSRSDARGPRAGAHACAGPSRGRSRGGAPRQSRAGRRRRSARSSCSGFVARSGHRQVGPIPRPRRQESAPFA